MKLKIFSNKEALFGYVGYTLTYINIDNQGHILSVMYEPSYRYLYPYVFSVSPSERFSIIGSSGDIYSTDSTLDYLGSLPSTHGAKKHAIFNDTYDLIYSASYEQSML